MPLNVVADEGSGPDVPCALVGRSLRGRTGTAAGLRRVPVARADETDETELYQEGDGR